MTEPAARVTRPFGFRPPFQSRCVQENRGSHRPCPRAVPCQSGTGGILTSSPRYAVKLLAIVEFRRLDHSSRLAGWLGAVGGKEEPKETNGIRIFFFLVGWSDPGFKGDDWGGSLGDDVLGVRLRNPGCEVFFCEAPQPGSTSPRARQDRPDASEAHLPDHGGPPLGGAREASNSFPSKQRI